MANNGDECRKTLPVVHVRIIARKELAEDVATKISEYLESEGYELLEQTGLMPSFVNSDEGKVFVTVR